MATVIRRSSELGDSRLLRIPFPEPGPTPRVRLSALNFQGGDGDAVTLVNDAETNLLLTSSSTGVPAAYKVAPDGVPAFLYDTSVATANPQRNVSLHRALSGGPYVYSFLAVMRMLRLPSAPHGTPDSEARVVGSYYGLAEGIYITTTTNALHPGKLIARGSSGGPALIGDPFPMDGRLHFVAVVFDGATGRLYLDGRETSGPIGSSIIGPHFITSGTLSGASFEIVEAASYTAKLTAAQIEAKRQHYRALYQF